MSTIANNKNASSKALKKRPNNKPFNNKVDNKNSKLKSKNINSNNNVPNNTTNFEKNLGYEKFPFDLYNTRPLSNTSVDKGIKKNKTPIEIPKFMGKKKLTITPKLFKQNKWDLANQESLKKLEDSKKNGNITTQGLYDQFKARRDKERLKLEQLKLVDRADTSKHLNDAIDFQGSCLEMCPVFERIRRELENNVSHLEKENNFASPNKAIKAFARPAASAPPPLPSDVRPPNVLVKTLNYIVDNILQTLPENEPFIWDRTRSIRQDFTLQNYFGPECVDCCEKIVRIHLLTVHIMVKNNADFSKQQELEQLNKSIVTLCEIYDEGRKRGFIYPNEAEIRSYWCLLNPRDPELDNQVQLLPKEIFNDKNFQLSLTFRRLMSNSFFKERGHKPINNGLNLTSTFFSLVAKNDTPLLLSCFFETFINEIRFYGILKLKQTWSKKVSKNLSFDVLQDLFKFNNDKEIIEICEYYSISVDIQARTLDLGTLLHDTHLLPEKAALKDTHLQCVENKLKEYASYSQVINSGKKNGLKMFQKAKITPKKDQVNKKNVINNFLEQPMKKNTINNKEQNLNQNFKKPQSQIPNKTNDSANTVFKNLPSDNNQNDVKLQDSFNLRRDNNATVGENKKEKEESKESSSKDIKKDVNFLTNLGSGNNNLKFSFGLSSSKQTESSNFNNVESQPTNVIGFGNKSSSLFTNNIGSISNKTEPKKFGISETESKSQDLGLNGTPTFKPSAVTSLINNNNQETPIKQTPDKPPKPIVNPELPKKQHSDSPIIDTGLIKKNTYKIIYNEILSETADLFLDDILVNKLLLNITMETKSDLCYQKNLKVKILTKIINKYKKLQLTKLKKNQMEISIMATKRLISDKKQRQISLNEFLSQQSNTKSSSFLNLTPVKNEKRQLKITKQLLLNNKNTNILKHYLNHINYNIKTNNNFNKFNKVDLDWLVYTSDWSDSSIKSILKIIGLNQIPFSTQQENIDLRISRYKPNFVPRNTQLFIFNTGITNNDIFDIDDFMDKEFIKLKQIINEISHSNHYKIDVLLVYWSNGHSKMFDLEGLCKFDTVNSVELVNINNESFINDMKLVMNSISTKFRFKFNGDLGHQFLQSKLKELLDTRIIGRSPMFEKKTLNSINERFAQFNKELLADDNDIKEEENDDDQYYLIDESNRKRKLSVINSVRKKQRLSSHQAKNYNFMNESNNSSNSTFESPPSKVVTSKKGIPTLIIGNGNNQRKSTFNHKNKRLITPINNNIDEGESGEVENDLSSKNISTPSTSSIQTILQFIKTPIRKMKD